MMLNLGIELSLILYSNLRSDGGNLKAKGTIYLSNIRMVFVANKPAGNVVAFDMPLVWKTLSLLPFSSAVFVTIYMALAICLRLVLKLIRKVLVKRKWVVLIRKLLVLIK